MNDGFNDDSYGCTVCGKDMCDHYVLEDDLDYDDFYEDDLVEDDVDDDVPSPPRIDRVLGLHVLFRLPL